mmetsp:Transcript_14449/g.29635  ORF Transcript_14449/g.29635 Transcript_14449/m.29635 type:complete len:294 (+) Transcript_14449:67-948(+)
MPAAEAAEASLRHRPWNSEFWSARSSAGGAHSASLPPSMVTIRSESKMVTKRCAMVMVVESLKRSRMDRCTMASVSKSMFAVASSMASTFGFRSTARARQMSCLCPVDQFEPPSSTTAPRPPGCCSAMPPPPPLLLPTPLFRSSSFFSAPSSTSMLTPRRALCPVAPSPSSPPPPLPLTPLTSSSLRRAAQRIASKIWASVNSPKASKLSRRLPTNNTGSWGMMPSVRRKVLRGRLATSTPSSRMRPPARGVMRNKATSRELLPDPDLPHTPTLVPPFKFKVKSCRTRGSPAR